MGLCRQQQEPTEATQAWLNDAPKRRRNLRSSGRGGCQRREREPDQATVSGDTRALPEPGMPEGAEQGVPQINLIGSSAIYPPSLFTHDKGHYHAQNKLPVPLVSVIADLP